MEFAALSAAWLDLASDIGEASILLWLEQTRLSDWIRTSTSMVAYPTILALHTVGLAWLVGPNLMINMRLLGFAPGISLGGLSRLFPVMIIGFWINLITGALLVMAFATEMFANPALYVKLAFIILAVINLRLVMKRVLQRPDADERPVPANAKILAVSSIALWIGAIGAGRLMAYVHLITG